MAAYRAADDDARPGPFPSDLHVRAAPSLTGSICVTLRLAGVAAMASAPGARTDSDPRDQTLVAVERRSVLDPLNGLSQLVAPVAWLT